MAQQCVYVCVYCFNLHFSPVQRNQQFLDCSQFKIYFLQPSSRTYCFSQKCVFPCSFLPPLPILWGLEKLPLKTRPPVPIVPDKTCGVAPYVVPCALLTVLCLICLRSSPTAVSLGISLHPCLTFPTFGSSFSNIIVQSYWYLLALPKITSLSFSLLL